MIADTNQTAGTEDAAKDQPTPPADEPKPGYKRIVMPSHTFDVKIEPDPLVDRAFGYVEGEARKFDEFANQLYAEAAKLVEDLKRADGSFAETYSTEAPFDAEAVFKAQQTIDAYYCALSNLRHAAEHCRAARLALSPYVDPKLLTRGY